MLFKCESIPLVCDIYLNFNLTLQFQATLPCRYTFQLNTFNITKYFSCEMVALTDDL